MEKFLSILRKTIDSNETDAHASRECCFLDFYWVIVFNIIGLLLVMQYIAPF